MNYSKNMSGAVGTIIHVLYTAWIFCVYAFSDSVTIYANSISAIIMAICILLMVRRKEIIIVKDAFFLVPFIALGFISVAWSISPSTTELRTRTTLLMFVFYYCIALYTKNYNDTSFLLHSVIIAANALCLFVISVYGFGFVANAIRYGSMSRIGQEFVNVNALGMILSLGCIFSLYYVLIYQKSKYIFSGVLPLLFALLTGSRKAIAFISIGILVIMIVRLKEKSKEGVRNKRIQTIWMFFIIIMGMVSIYNSPIGDLVRVRIEGMFASGSQQDFSTLERNSLIQIGLNQFFRTPFLGCGLGSSDVLTGGTYLHNNYVELLATMGICGTVMYYCFHLKHATNLIHCFFRGELTREKGLVLLALLVVFVSDMGSVGYFSKTTYILFLIITTFSQQELR